MFRNHSLYICLKGVRRGLEDLEFTWFSGGTEGRQSSAYAFSTNVLFEQENVIFIEEGSPLRAILLHAAIPQMKINRTVPYKVR